MADIEAHLASNDSNLFIVFECLILTVFSAACELMEFDLWLKIRNNEFKSWI